MNERINSLNTELRAILETEGSLTEDQVLRVEAIEEEITEIETEARDFGTRARIEERLSKPRFNTTTGTARVENDDPTERFADWAIGGDLRAYNSLSDGAGGALVPLDLTNELITRLNGVPGVRQAVESRVYGENVEIARIASRPSLTAFTGETVAYTDISSTFDSVRSYAFKATASSEISEELQADSRPAVLREVLEAQIDAMGLFWDAQFAVDGAGGANGPEAIFNSGQTGLNVMETGTSDSIDLDDLLVAQLEALPAQYRNGSFSYLMHPTVESVLRREKDDSGRFQLLPHASGTSAGMPGSTIHGIPVVISTNAPTLTECVSDNSKIAVMMIDRSSYRVMDRAGLRTQRDEFSKGSTGEIVFRASTRSDGRWLAPWRSVGIKLKA